MPLGCFLRDIRACDTWSSHTTIPSLYYLRPALVRTQFFTVLYTVTVRALLREGSWGTFSQRSVRLPGRVRISRIPMNPCIKMYTAASCQLLYFGILSSTSCRPKRSTYSLERVTQIRCYIVRRPLWIPPVPHPSRRRDILQSPTCQRRPMRGMRRLTP